MTNSPNLNQEKNEKISATQRFTGFWIPVEIWEIEEITALDAMVLSMVDSLYDKKRGGCFASNSYIAQKLKVKENTIQKSLHKLRELDLVENVSFDGRCRIMRAKIHEHVVNQQLKDQSTSEVDLNPPLRLTKIHPYIKEDNKDKESLSKERLKKAEPTGSPPPAAKAASSSSPAAKRLTTLLYEKLKELNPTMKTPKIPTWEREMDKILRIDKRKEEEVERLIRWIFEKSDFWCKNILSTCSLRRHYDKIYTQAFCRKKGPGLLREYKA